MPKPNPARRQWGEYAEPDAPEPLPYAWKGVFDALDHSLGLEVIPIEEDPRVEKEPPPGYEGPRYERGSQKADNNADA